MLSLTMINRRYSVNQDYFNVIDTEQKAYWLGFIWADGAITKTTNRASGPNRLRIAQTESERKHLEKFQKDINADYAIKIVKRNDGHTLAQIDINSRTICQALENLGYGTKSKRIHIPPITKKMIRHFIRGYFDGDGCLSLYTQTIKKWKIRKHEWSITGYENFISEIKEILTKKANVTENISLKRYKRSPNIVSLRYGKKADIKLLYKYLYKDATIYLETKYQKFIEFLSANPNG